MGNLETKKALCLEMLGFIHSGMTIGLGTGTTSEEFIKTLAQAIHEGRFQNIITTASSEKSKSLAKSLGIPIVLDSEITVIDIYVDSADEVDRNYRMIKGGGGALTREKILLESARQKYILVDEDKLVKELGAFGLPIEILPFGSHFVELKLRDMGYKGSWRLAENNEKFITDNGNYLLDVYYPSIFSNPKQDVAAISMVAGVVEVGLFITDMTLLIGYKDGRIERLIVR